MRIAVLAAAALIVLAMVALIGFAVQRQLRGKPIEHHEAPYPPTADSSDLRCKPARAVGVTDRLWSRERIGDEH
jgi:hypothetical protein